jgi:sugar diacid utilization regulator
LSAYASAQGVRPAGSALDLCSRVDAVLEGAVTDLLAAERMLGYRLANHHVGVVVWFEDSLARPAEMLAADRCLRALPGVRDALVVPKDECTLRCWLNVFDYTTVDGWVEIVREPERPWKVAFGEPGAGLEGFRLSHLQALVAAAVLAAARPEAGSVARYQDVSTIGFMLDQPVEARAWVKEILGDLARPGAQRERLRHTLHIFFEEGEDAVATSRRLFVHRNTVNYRLDQARERLPRGFARERLEVALALKYCEWIPVFESQRSWGGPVRTSIAV